MPKPRDAKTLVAAKKVRRGRQGDAEQIARAEQAVEAHRALEIIAQGPDVAR